MISIELLTKHMAWANQEIYKEIKKLDPEVLDYYVIDKEWTVRIIMVHIVTASYLYSQRLQEKPFSKIEFDMESPDLIDDLIDALENIDKDLIEQSYREDEEVTFETSKGESSGKVSVILSCLLYTSPSPRDGLLSRMPSSA